MIIPPEYVHAGSSTEKRCGRHFGISMKYGAFELLYLR